MKKEEEEAIGLCNQRDAIEFSFVSAIMYNIMPTYYKVTINVMKRYK